MAVVAGLFKASGAKNVTGGAYNVAAGIITMDWDRVQKGAGQWVNGVLNFVTFGGFDLLVDWVKDQIPDAPEQSFQDRKVMARGANTPRQIVYGQARVGGQLVFLESTGADSQFLHMIVVVAPHAVNSIREIYLNDELAFNANGSATSQFSGKVDLIKELGTQTTANATIVSRLTNWTNDHKLLGCAYVYVRLSYDKDLFSRGVPSVSAVVRGRSVLDPRSNTSYYTDNHALCVLDYLRSPLGFRCQDPEIDFDSFANAANVSDEQFFDGTRTGGTEPRYTLNGTISLAGSPLDNLSSMARAGAALINYVQGEFQMVPGTYVAPSASFDESDLIGGIQVSPGPGKSQLTNTAKGTYIAAAQDYEPVQFPPIAPADYLARDGEELATEIPMPFANSATLARRMAKLFVEQERYGASASLTLKYTAMGVTVGDRINLSIARFGWVDRVFRIESATVTMSGGIQVKLREDAPKVWEWAEGEAIAVNPPPALILPNFGTVLAPLNFTVTESLYTTNTRSDFKVRINLSWDSASSAGRLYDIQFRRFGDSEWVDDAANIQGNEWFIADFELGQFEFRIRAKAVVGNSLVSPWVTQAFEVLGKQAPPAPPATLSAVQRSYGIDVEWTAVNELDIMLYELRLDENFGGPGAIYSGRQTSFQDVRRVSGVTYYVRALDTSGNYSAESTQITPTIGAPKAVSSVTASSIDNNVLLRWSTSESVYPIAYYTIRRGQSFGTASTVGESSGTFEAIIEESSGTFRYWVQPVDAAGQIGTAVGAFASVDSPPDYILRADDFVDFEQMGLTNVAIGFGGGGEDWNDTSLSWDGDTLRWDDGPSLDLIGPVNSTESFGDNMTRSGLALTDPYGQKYTNGFNQFLQPAVLSGEARRVIDFGALIPTTRVTIFMDEEEIIPGASVIIKMSTSEDGVTWTEFGDNQTEFSASNFQFLRINLAFTSGGTGLLRVNSIRFKLDVKQKTDQGRADVFAADVDGTTVLLNKAFIDIDSVTATPKAVDAKIAVTQFEDVGNQDRFSVYVFDRATGDRVDATINWIARGS